MSTLDNILDWLKYNRAVVVIHNQRTFGRKFCSENNTVGKRTIYVDVSENPDLLNNNMWIHKIISGGNVELPYLIHDIYNADNAPIQDHFSIL